MPKAIVVKRGKEFLPDIELATLEEMVRKEKPGKARDILQAAVLRKRDIVLKKISLCIGHSVSTIHGWLARIALEGLDRRYDNKSPGRPSGLTQEEQRVLEDDLSKSPTECGYRRGNWNSRMAARHIDDKFGKKYSRRSVSRLASKLGFSYRKPRPIPYNSARLLGNFL